jgi:hypothetical protein
MGFFIKKILNHTERYTAWDKAPERDYIYAIMYQRDNGVIVYVVGYFDYSTASREYRRFSEDRWILENGHGARSSIWIKLKLYKYWPNQ